MKSPRTFPAVASQAERMRISHHQARIVRYGLDLTEFIEAMPPTADMIERQEARTLITPVEED